MRIVNSILTIFIFSFAIIVKGEVNANYNSANQLYADGKYEEAITAYEAIINSDYLSSDIYYNLGNAYYKTQHFQESLPPLSQAIRINPKYAQAHYVLCMVNELVGNEEAAQKHYQIALKLNPKIEESM